MIKNSMKSECAVVWHLELCFDLTLINMNEDKHIGINLNLKDM